MEVVMSELERAYRDHAVELVRFATVVAGPAEADDVVSEALLSCTSSRRWPEVENERAYLYRSVLNVSRMHRRSVGRRRQREYAARSETPNSEGYVQPEVLQALRSLSPRQRAVVFFMYWVDLGTDDIAQQLDISVRTVQREAESARHRLREVLT